ncbi:uncharacterized protein LOC141910142 [Tubulanus polymorphus]|uniref:uncharacterized protein LOC141910142 n=1 Tax=Tubulanus polymorphus TaxID=672921 RepID=UPI003DA49446
MRVDMAATRVALSAGIEQLKPVLVTLILVNLAIKEALAYNIKEKPKCDDNYQVVCQTIMKLPRGETLEEIPYCNCPACTHISWDSKDSKSMTWVHHEKSDWMVQYKFCKPLEEMRTCVEGDEIAIQLETDIQKWNPRLKLKRCECPVDPNTGERQPYRLKWWKKVGGKWVYSYSCTHRKCTPSERYCVKRYIDPADRTTEYNFQCTCAPEYYCPTDYEELDKALYSPKADGLKNEPQREADGRRFKRYCCRKKGSKIDVYQCDMDDMNLMHDLVHH